MSRKATEPGGLSTIWMFTLVFAAAAAIAWWNDADLYGSMIVAAAIFLAAGLVVQEVRKIVLGALVTMVLMVSRGNFLQGLDDEAHRKEVERIWRAVLGKAGE